MAKHRAEQPGSHNHPQQRPRFESLLKPYVPGSAQVAQETNMQIQSPLAGLPSEILRLIFEFLEELIKADDEVTH
ncbi:hypothetical protein, partial [Staphylococcus hominis]|uniref:hypothetical protein n=1 Tax=Staphylococcus hominis TaxID=1290 RepID=UPI0039BFE7ED